MPDEQSVSFALGIALRRSTTVYFRLWRCLDRSTWAGVCQKMWRFVVVGVALTLLTRVMPDRERPYAMAAANPGTLEAEHIASLCGAIWSPQAKIAAKDGVLCAFMPQIDSTGAREFVALLRTKPIQWVLIVSYGGDVGSALDMADAISESGASLIINGPCLSSCANYIFLAAREKYVLSGGVVAWHGGIPDAASSESDPLAPLIARSNAFFDRIGVDKRLFEQFPQELANSAPFHRAIDAKVAPFWTYPEADLEKRFMVTGIRAYWFPEYSEWKKKAPALVFRTDHRS